MADRTVASMFPADHLKRLKVSDNVHSMTPADLNEMAKAFGTPPHKTENKKVLALTTHDLITLESLFGEYRMEVIANFQSMAHVDTALRAPRSEGSSCCCCCTPCCCCTAAVDSHPFDE
jgi:hypothetical protein